MSKLDKQAQKWIKESWEDKRINKAELVLCAIMWLGIIYGILYELAIK